MHPDYIDALAAIDRDPNQEMFVVDLDGTLVGCFQLSYLPGLMRRGMWRGQIEVVHVSAAMRNRGIGGEMMRWGSRTLPRARLRHGAAHLQQAAHRRPPLLRAARLLKSHEGFKYYF